MSCRRIGRTRADASRWNVSTRTDIRCTSRQCAGTAIFIGTIIRPYRKFCARPSRIFFTLTKSRTIWRRFTPRAPCANATRIQKLFSLRGKISGAAIRRRLCGWKNSCIAIFAPQPRARATDEFVIGYAGRLVAEKGVDVLLRAAAQLPGAWRLRIIGSGPAQASLAASARALQIASRVEFSSWTDSAAMPRWYNSLDVLALPSLTRPNWKEQFGRVLTEAMACGVPVIGAASGEIPYVIGDAGIVVPEHDADALARALSELMRAPTRRQQLAQAGRARALEKFSEQKIVDDTWSFYQSLR
ncbi:MAG: hypothetical protein DCC52_17565 [Chloroflexi bacterium]|nr:MAG: hypothetical protein DCC52_17565 [Chloroflexota bacterium]